MHIVNLKDSNLTEFGNRSRAVLAACGYESRSAAIALRVPPRIDRRVALCFSEWADALSRKKNEDVFQRAGFASENVSGNDGNSVASIVVRMSSELPKNGSLAFDISSMTRAWHGAIIRALRGLKLDREIETFFIYVPATFSNPPRHTSAYEVVAPAEGFASLSPPDLPVASVIGLGYEKERALGLQQLLDPKRTVLMIPRFRSRRDQFYSEVLRSNQDILARVPPEWRFHYWVDEPASTYSALATFVSQMLPSYRVVLASLGPKMLGILCFLLATQFPQVSVWRASSGIHGKPRESLADPKHTVVLSVTWAP